jgi:2-methylcitrate dehydratase PrpD
MYEILRNPATLQLVGLRSKTSLDKESRDYPGFVSQPMSWKMACDKFNRVAEPYTTDTERKAVMGAVADLEGIAVRELMQLLACVNVQPAGRSIGHSRTEPPNRSYS